MKLLALDTATEQCSVALLLEQRLIERKLQTARAHADLILPMVQEVLDEAGLSLSALDALAFGRGPGAFTGVRIAVGVAQGLALGAGLPVLPISNLAAVAQQVAQKITRAGMRILVCMDARMGEVYWAVFEVDQSGLVTLCSEEQVTAPEQVQLENRSVQMAVGTGFAAYPILTHMFAGIEIDAQRLPAAAEIARLAVREWQAGKAVPANEALPVYLRNQVAHVKRV